MRDALAFAARAEKPNIAKHIADMVHQIDTLVSTDALIDKLENRNPGDKGMWGPMVDFEYVKQSQRQSKERPVSPRPVLGYLHTNRRNAMTLPKDKQIKQDHIESMKIAVKDVI